MRKSLLVLLILLLAVSCSDKNPVNSGDGAGTAVIICTIITEQAAKPTVLNPTTSAKIIFYDSNDALLTQETLTVIGKRITGSVKVKAGSGYRVELLCYDISNNITHSGTASNVSIVANKTTTITILLTPAIPDAPQADGPDSTMVSGTQYTITWTEVSRAISYTIEEALNSSFTEPVQKTIVGTSESYTKNTDVAKSYYYRVRANNSAGNSGWSNTVAVTIEPVPAKQYTLTMAVNQSGRGTTTPAVGPYSYDESSVVVITATPAEGYRFVYWTGDVADPDSSSTTVTMTGDKTLTVNFEEIPPVEPDITFVSIPAGSFDMGSNDGKYDEKPIHTVTLDAFEMSATEITQIQYESIMEDNPSYIKYDENLPVEHVTWYDAVIFCNRLSDLAGLQHCYNEETWKCDFGKNGFCLPTEAEWEYACKAGTNINYYSKENESELAKIAWYWGNCEGVIHPVGLKEPNPWGLYDIHGNVSEWCNDWYSGEYYQRSSELNPTGMFSGIEKVYRGSDLNTKAESNNWATLRMRRDPDVSGFWTIGFRIVRRPEE